MVIGEVVFVASAVAASEDGSPMEDVLSGDFSSDG